MDYESGERGIYLYKDPTETIPTVVMVQWYTVALRNLLQAAKHGMIMNTQVLSSIPGPNL